MFIHRFIPAGAGNTLPGGAGMGPLSVYPRWRGEHINSDSLNGIDNGLSPLARGTQSDVD